MIGQTQLLQELNIILNRYPKFSIIVGPKGSGKKTIVEYICKHLNLPMVTFGISIEEVRQIIDLSYEQKNPICYVCADADEMSLGAKNCLLKVTEEPPNNAYFILTLQSMSNTLETISSRGTVFTLDPYSKQDLIEYIKLKGYPLNYSDLICNICTTTGEIDELLKNKEDFYLQQFYKFAQTVAYKIHEPKSGNIFKISKQVKTKTNPDGYDPILLFKTVRNLYIEKAIETKKVQYINAANVTTVCLQDLQIAVLSTVATIDIWIMNVRRALGGI